jgi:uncharacterized protein (DUF302 family)
MAPPSKGSDLKEFSMKLVRSLVALTLFTCASIVVAADGLILLNSPHSAEGTMGRLEDVVKQRGLKVFARIDHAAGAAQIGKALRPTAVLIFGNPQGGTPLMQCAQSMGIDLPLKALVWQDDTGQVWLGYNDPVYLAQRHGVGQCPAIENVQKALSSIAKETVAR